jgi:hypothetical protein
MPSYAGDADATALQMDEEQNVVRDQSSPGEHFHRKEVGTRQNVFMGGDKILPRSSSTSLRRPRNPVTAQNVYREDEEKLPVDKNGICQSDTDECGRRKLANQRDALTQTCSVTQSVTDADAPEERSGL